MVRANIFAIRNSLLKELGFIKGEECYRHFAPNGATAEAKGTQKATPHIER
jgi:hypothetical protein